MRALSRAVCDRPVAVGVLAAAAALAGWIGWQRLPIELLPDLQSPTIVVVLRSAGRQPAEMQRQFGEQIEQRMLGIRSIRELTQSARAGRLVATVRFDWRADMDRARLDVEEALGPLRSDPTVDALIVRRFDPRDTPTAVVGVTPRGRDVNLAELREIARRHIAPALEQLDSVAFVRVVGGRDQELRLVVDPRRLDAYGLTLQQLSSRLREANVDIDAGTVESEHRVYQVRGRARIRDPEELPSLVVAYAGDGSSRQAPVRLRDVADVRLENRDTDHVVRINAKEGVSLAIYKRDSATAVAASTAIQQRIAEIGRSVPTIETVIVADQATAVKAALAEAERAALLGIALAVVVLAVFLRSAAPTVIVALAVPISLLVTLLAMYVHAKALNLLTLGGLALGSGLAIDNAIVVAESIARRLDSGDTPKDAAVNAMCDVAGPLTISSLTTCIVFLPVFFISGLMARLASDLAFVMISAVLASLAVALLWVPAVSVWLLPRDGWRRPPARRFRIEPLVLVLVRRPLRTMIPALAIVAGAVCVLARMGTELVPPSGLSPLVLTLQGPPSQSLRATIEVATAAEAILRQAAGSDLRAIVAEVGRLPEDDRAIVEEPPDENQVRLIADLQPMGRSARDVAAAARAAIGALANQRAVWDVTSSRVMTALGVTDAPIAIDVSARALGDLPRGSQELYRRLAGRAELWNVRTSLQEGPPELRIVMDRVAASGLGVTPEIVADAVEASLQGHVVTTLTSGERENPIVLRLPGDADSHLTRVPLRTPGGPRLALGQIARVVEERGPAEIRRKEQRTVVRLTAHVAPGVSYPAAIAAARAALEETTFPPGVSTDFGGEEKERAQIVRDARLAAFLAITLVLMLLAAAFESLVHPLTIIAAIPFAFVGAVAMLAPGGTPLGPMAMFGLVTLAGVAVSHAILLVATARRFIRNGEPVRAAVARAADLRLRPILMTAITTSLVLAPLATTAGDAAAIHRPLAFVLIGGLLVSAAASVLVIPCVYVVVDRCRRGGARA